MKSECGLAWGKPQFMKSGLMDAGFLTTDYTDLHGWKRWNLFLSYFDGRVEHKEHKDFFVCGLCVHSHFMKSECRGGEV